MTAVMCGIEMSEIAASTSSHPWMNVGYKDYAMAEGYCNWERGDTCPAGFDLCSGVQQGTPAVCNGNGTCHYHGYHKENYCDCDPGMEGDNCEVQDAPFGQIPRDCVALNGYCYYFFNVKKRWFDAREYCKAAWDPVADLAIVSDEDIQAVVSALLPPKREAWIGGYDYHNEGTFEWVGRTPIVYANWYGRADDGGKYGEDCVSLKELEDHISQVGQLRIAGDC